jgi:hypothetical protein
VRAIKIKLDDKYILNSDPYCYWISIKVTPESGKEYDRVVSGYYTHIDDVIKSYIDKKVRSSEAESLKELVKEVNTLKKQIKSWKNVIEGKKQP